MTICNNTYCQDRTAPTINLDVLDVYILQFRIDTLVAPIKRYPCTPPKHKKMAIYRIEIMNIVHRSDTVTFKESELKNIKFALFPNNMAKGDFTGSFYAAANKEYLFFNRMWTIDQNPNQKYFQHAFVMEFSCTKADKALKVIEKYKKRVSIN
jgi:hypothetical protein